MPAVRNGLTVNSRRASAVLKKLTSRVGALGMAELLPGVDLSTVDATTPLAACPDHYLLRGFPDGRQEVIETTGGSPTATRFLVDYRGGTQVTIPTNPGYPVQIAGQAPLAATVTFVQWRHVNVTPVSSCDAVHTRDALSLSRSGFQSFCAPGGPPAFPGHCGP